MPTADLIFKNAAVITVDAQQPGAEFVAIKGDKIIFAGAKDYLNDFTGPKTKFIDCAGKTLLPGFNDAHCHIFSLLRKLTSVELGFPKIKSINDIKGAIKKQVAKTPPGEWITGTDYNEFYLVEKRHPTRWEIDEVAPDNPVMLTHRSLHGCVLNSKALELAGITIETPEMPGTMIDRDVTRGGEPNGFLAEMVGYLREHVLPRHDFMATVMTRSRTTAFGRVRRHMSSRSSSGLPTILVSLARERRWWAKSMISSRAIAC